MHEAPAIPGYRIIGLTGSGGSAAVWQAVEEAGGTAVAIKVPHRPGAVEALRREAAVLSAVRHRGLVAVRDVVWLPDGTPALVVELAGAGSLADRVSAQGVLAPAVVARIAAEVADTLADLHARGVLHGDVTPSNLLWSEPGPAVLADLGSARLLGERAVPAAGTPGFVDPAGVGSPGADVYGLAASAWWMLTGQPGEGRPPRRAWRLGRRTGPSVGLELAELTETLRAGMHPDPRLRPSAADLAERLARVAASPGLPWSPADPRAPVVAPPAGPDGPRPPDPDRALPPALGAPSMTGDPAPGAWPSVDVSPAPDVTVGASAGTAPHDGSSPDGGDVARPVGGTPAAVRPMPPTVSRPGDRPRGRVAAPAGRHGRPARAWRHRANATDHADATDRAAADANGDRARRPSRRSVALIVTVVGLGTALLAAGILLAGPMRVRHGSAASGHAPTAVAATTRPATHPTAQARSPAPARPGPAPPPGAPVADWTAVLGDLDAHRSRAFSDLDAAALLAVDAVGSPALAADGARLAALAQRGVHAAGLHPTLLAVVAASSPSPAAGSAGTPAERVSLRVRDALPGYDLVSADGTVVARQPPRAEATWLITLVSDRTGWLVWSVQAG